jgi:cell division initiation protein
MRLTPVDIRQQQFTVRAFRGFDRQEVEAFLEAVAAELEALLKDNARLREEVASHVERARGAAAIDKTLKDTLVMTRQLADQAKENALREAQSIVRDAELRGEKLLEDTRGEEARIRADIQMLKRTRRQLIEDLKSTVEMYQRMIASDLQADPGDAPRPR